MRERIYNIIDGPEEASSLSRTYNYAMIIVVLVSLVPLAFKTETPAFFFIDNDKLYPVQFIILYTSSITTVCKS